MKQALIEMVFGLLLALIGVGVSLASYAFAAGKGGVYFVAWGAVAVGAIRIIIGLCKFVVAAFKFAAPQGQHSEA